jgi:hypothetical protein
VSGLEVTYCPKAIIRPRAMVYSFYLIQQTIYRVDRKKSLITNLYSKKASKRPTGGRMLPIHFLAARITALAALRSFAVGLAVSHLIFFSVA